MTHLRLYILSALFLVFSGANAQQHFADKSYYIVDSLNPGKLNKQDKHLLDSCLKVYHNTSIDTIKLIVLKKLADEVTDTVTWFAYAREYYRQAQEDLKKTGLSLKMQKRFFAYAGNATSVINYYYKIDCNNPKAGEPYIVASIDYFTKAGDRRNMAASMTDLAGNYDDEGRIKDAIKLNLDALKILEDVKDTVHLIIAYQNTGNLLRNQNDFRGAMPYFKKSDVLAKARKDGLGLSSGLNLLAICYKNLNEYDSALIIYKYAFQLDDSLHNEYGKASVLLNEGVIYQNQGNLDKALDNYKLSLEKFERTGDKNAIAYALNSIAIANLKKKNYPDALIAAERAMKLAKEIGYPDDILNASQLLSQLYKITGRYKEALEMNELCKKMSDSILSAGTKRDAIERDVKYQHEKELMKVQNEKEKEEIKAAQEQKNRNNVIIAISLVLMLVIGFSAFLYNRFRIIRKQKSIIERQKHEVEKKNEEIGEKNKDILASITYAKRLQDAILPPLTIIKKYLPDSFVLYKPKDIVAGDFYWMERVGDSILIAAADCTGHGVPGALVSVVCSNALNRAVKEFKVTEPGKILDKVRELVLETFEKSESEVKDGMDISLSYINTKTGDMQWSGAYNGLWYIQQNEIKEVAADKQPVGVHINTHPFSTHNLKLKKGDQIYLFTDGYADQFGGPKGKKFKYKQFQDKLLSIAGETMARQEQILNETIEDWRGQLEQVDDILVIGIRI